MFRSKSNANFIVLIQKRICIANIWSYLIGEHKYFTELLLRKKGFSSENTCGGVMWYIRHSSMREGVCFMTEAICSVIIVVVTEDIHLCSVNIERNVQ